MKELKKAIGLRIRAIRNQLKLNQEIFGEKVGASAPAISTYETGDVQPPYGILLKIADLGKVTLDWLIRGEKTEIPKDIKEKYLLELYRNIEKMDSRIAEEYINYGKWKLENIKKGSKASPVIKSKILRHKES